MKTKFLIVAIVISLVSIGVNIVQYNFEKTVIVKLTNDLNNERTKNYEYVLQEDRIKCITKTLMLAYGLSKWETHYYALMFNDFATSYDIPWEIYAAIVRVESNFKCTNVSPKGAKGMWQLLEGTGKGVADELGINYIKEQTLWNDYINFILGATYLTKNIKAKGLEGGVKSYLGGPAYLVSIKSNEEAKQYIGEYKTTVWKEYKNLCYIYRGIVGELNKYPYAEIHKCDYQDSINIDITIFTDVDKVKIDSVPEKVEPVKKVVVKKVKPTVKPIVKKIELISTEIDSTVK